MEGKYCSHSPKQKGNREFELTVFLPSNLQEFRDSSFLPVAHMDQPLGLTEFGAPHLRTRLFEVVLRNYKTLVQDGLWHLLARLRVNNRLNGVDTLRKAVHSHPVRRYGN
jgi:hypothetical protein